MWGPSDVLDEIMRNPLVKKCLDEIRQYDETTYQHSCRVGVLALWLGCNESIDYELLIDLGIAGLLHDYGKVKIPIEVINKPDKLTEEEYAIVKAHPLEGSLMLQKMGFSANVIRAVAEHHEGDSSRGYPFSIELDHLFILSRIVEVADIFDAMHYARCYRSTAISKQEIYDNLLQDKRVDNTIVNALKNLKF